MIIILWVYFLILIMIFIVRVKPQRFLKPQRFIENMLKKLITELILTLLFNSLIAIFVNLLIEHHSLKISFIY
jgi:hypothetical protein